VERNKRRTLRSLAVIAALAGCAQLPTITFVSDGGAPGSGPPTTDATVPVADAAGVEDAGFMNDGPVDQPTDDAGAEAAATIKCGSELVRSCGACPGLPLRCKKAGRDECLADCASCAANWFPCLHCPTPDAAPRGSCIPVNANGQIACAKANLCGCNADTDCLAVTGAAATCDVENGRKGCLTCGAPTTAGVACVSGAGVSGTCKGVDGAPPKCN
jgi:hypothetical protein